MPLNPANFPSAKIEGYDETSPQTRFYNCIAYAAGDTTRWWRPNSAPIEYWPDNIPQRETIYAFLELFKSLGYEKCDDGQLENGFEKVAIYALDNNVTHAALQLPNGHWTSKIGRNIDVEHYSLEALEGPLYGQVARFLKRPI